MISELFYGGTKSIFGQMGRSTGKTDIAIYCAIRWARRNPGTQNYIFEPQQNQAREIIWASKRLELMIPKEWILAINQVEMRITLTNGSFIKLDGADNTENRRGIKPNGLVVYDEFKDHKPKFVEAMEPNRIGKGAPALFLGTPPEVHNHYIEFGDYAKKTRGWAYFHAPSSSNPYNNKEMLEEARLRLIAMNNYEYWLREYEAVFVKGGKNHIFPQFLKLLPYGLEIPKDLNRWVLYVIFDPAASSTFGVLFVLFNPYTKKIKIVDEIYEQDMARMTAKVIWEETHKKIDEWKAKGIREFHYSYDEAAAWFRNESSEVNRDKGVWLTPTDKNQHGKEAGIGLIRDLLLFGYIEVAKNCTNFIDEMESYILDEKGKIPKVKDHLIDCLRYFLAAAGFKFEGWEPPKPVDPDTEKRFHKPEDEIFSDDSPPEELD